ncbi:hypothetical protein EVAR_21590_1 [Eumeta japonica]|uniref:Uncharacterized protein n=1 Tax=Eumeta variegata TaxID=151549 RepID=A0A4C1UYW3_EUMVA|nr:hypothetical protein EVAR_21590_1 [Eumeta japonica]
MSFTSSGIRIESERAESRTGLGPESNAEMGPKSRTKLKSKTSMGTGSSVKNRNQNRRNSSRVGCVRPLFLFYSDASADGVEERSLVPRSRSHARLRRNATMSHSFFCVQPEFIDL